jgi:hypothetical protein
MTRMRLDWGQKIDGQSITSTSAFSAGVVKHANVFWLSLPRATSSVNIQAVGGK